MDFPGRTLHPVRVQPASQATVTCQSPEEESLCLGLGGCQNSTASQTQIGRHPTETNTHSFQDRQLTRPPSRPQSQHLCRLPSHVMLTPTVERLNGNLNIKPILPPHPHPSPDLRSPRISHPSLSSHLLGWATCMFPATSSQCSDCLVSPQVRAHSALHGCIMQQSLRSDWCFSPHPILPPHL